MKESICLLGDAAVDLSLGMRGFGDAALLCAGDEAEGREFFLSLATGLWRDVMVWLVSFARTELTAQIIRAVPLSIWSPPLPLIAGRGACESVLDDLPGAAGLALVDDEVAAFSHDFCAGGDGG